MKNWLTYEHGIWKSNNLLGDDANPLEWVSSGYVTFDPDKVVAISDIEGEDVPEPSCAVYLTIGQFFVKEDHMRVSENVQNALS